MKSSRFGLTSIRKLVLGLVIAVGSLHNSAVAPAQERQAALAELAQAHQEMLQPTMQTTFPQLGNRFEVLAPSTRKYNCVAHALGYDDRWVNPITGEGHDPLAPMTQMLARHGYRRLQRMDTSVQPGIEKVALYGRLSPDGNLAEVTHAARQSPDGKWTSKLGGMPLIRHATLDSLRGPGYGTAVAVYSRPARPASDGIVGYRTTER